MSSPSWIKNEYLKTHLKYVHNTESPIIMHVWAALGAAATSMSRHVWLDTGIGRMYPNMYCLLVGPPGTRKNAAINYAVNIMRDVAEVKFAPDDTGGQRQGLITAIEDADKIDLKENLMTQVDNLDFSDIDSVVDKNLEKLNKINVSIKQNDPDLHALFICATEFGSFLGQGSLDMTRFLIKMWDGEDYKYKVKKDFNILKNPLLNMLGGTTASDLATLLPPEAIGQGFMSRVILVYAAGKAKSVPPTRACLRKDLLPELEKVFKYVAYELKGSMTMTKEAETVSENIYMKEIKLPDTRFIYYSERRHTHLTKLAMVLAATNLRSTIEDADLIEADEILKETEKYMPQALGEYGLSPLSLARQKVLDLLIHAKTPVTKEIMWAYMQKDMRLLDFRNCLSDLLNANKIREVKSGHDISFVYVEDMTDILSLVGNKI